MLDSGAAVALINGTSPWRRTPQRMRRTGAGISELHLTTMCRILLNHNHNENTACFGDRIRPRTGHGLPKPAVSLMPGIGSGAPDAEGGRTRHLAACWPAQPLRIARIPAQFLLPSACGRLGNRLSGGPAGQELSKEAPGCGDAARDPLASSGASYSLKLLSQSVTDTSAGVTGPCELTQLSWRGLLDGGGRAIQKIHRGRVKWYNVAKGFGFVVSDEAGPDILIHVNVLRNFGQTSVADGSIVELMAQESHRGLQATEIISISAPPPIDPMAPAAGAAPDMPSSPLEPARVKWFDKLRGFGFVNIYGSAEDVFVHMEVLRQSRLADLQAGEAVAIRIRQGPRGKMVYDIQPWEAGLPGNAYGAEQAPQATEIEGDFEGDGPE